MAGHFDAIKIKEVIDDFLATRLQLKLDKLKEDQHEERVRLIAAHEQETWLEDAARRVNQIQQVTHAVKYTHPDARGSSLYSGGNAHANESLAGSHSLGDQLEPDVVGNAAALDVYKFLRLDLGGQTVLDLAVSGDRRLHEALSLDAEKADSWMQAFADLMTAKGTPASHTLAKQLYWPLGGGQYHLLAPLFPSSLATYVWRTVREHRFSEEVKEARQARKEERPWPHGYHEYRNIVVQKFGGTKPQNISQLNSERRGENYLLPSVPPNWQSSDTRAPRHTDSIFRSAFARRRSTRDTVDELKHYLRQVVDFNNRSVRQGRARRVQRIIDELLQYAAGLWQLEPGWSAHPDCSLNMEEQCWLDPDRALVDGPFAEICERGDWRDAICRRFANWLNARLSESGSLPVGEEEAQEWRRLLDHELTVLYRELGYHE